VPETLCSVKIASGDVTGESNFLFEPVNGSTRFTTVAELDLGFFKFAQTIVKHKIKRQLKNDMSTLKKILENGEHVKMP
jgi:hypothetical protein